MKKIDIDDVISYFREIEKYYRNEDTRNFNELEAYYDLCFERATVCRQLIRLLNETKMYGNQSIEDEDKNE